MDRVTRLSEFPTGNAFIASLSEQVTVQVISPVEDDVMTIRLCPQTVQIAIKHVTQLEALCLWQYYAHVCITNVDRLCQNCVRFLPLYFCHAINNQLDQLLDGVHSVRESKMQNTTNESCNLCGAQWDF